MMAGWIGQDAIDPPSELPSGEAEAAPGLQKEILNLCRAVQQGWPAMGAPGLGMLPPGGISPPRNPIPLLLCSLGI